MPQPLDLRALKQSARNLADSRRNAAGWTAVCFFLVLFVLQSAIALLSDAVIQLPTFQTAEEMILYFANGHTKELLLLLLFDVLPLMLTFIFITVFSAYCLKLTQGQPAGGNTLCSSLYAAFRGFLFIVLLLVALFVFSSLLSLLGLFIGNLVIVLLLACAVFAIVLFYALRLCLFSIADRKDSHIFLALKDSITMTKGAKLMLFFLDLSFLWFMILLTVISLVCSLLPDAVSVFASGIGNTALSTWISANGAMLSPLCSVLGALLSLPLYYKYFTYIQLTYALVYQELSQKLLPRQDEQPLAYQEFDSFDAQS